MLKSIRGSVPQSGLSKQLTKTFISEYPILIVDSEENCADPNRTAFGKVEYIDPTYTICLSLIDLCLAG